MNASINKWIVLNICNKCSIKVTPDCNYDVCSSYRNWRSKIEDAANYYSTVIIPEKIKQAEQKLIDEIDILYQKCATANCDKYHHDSCIGDFCGVNCTLWQQLKQKRGI